MKASTTTNPVVVTTKASLLQALKQNNEHPTVLQFRILHFLEQQTSPQSSPPHGWCRHPKLLVALLSSIENIQDSSKIQIFWRHRILKELQQCMACVDAYHYHISLLVHQKLLKEFSVSRAAKWMEFIWIEEEYRLHQTLTKISKNLDLEDQGKTLLKVCYYEWTKYPRMWKDLNFRKNWLEVGI